MDNDSYKKMIWDALVKKYAANTSLKKKSKRDEIREYNSTHRIQLPLRTKLSPFEWESK